MITVYFDFLCPYAWRGVELLSGLNVPFEPVHYSLVQGNHAENVGQLRSAPVWKLAEQPLEGNQNHTQSFEAFLASHAAAQQGSKLHHQFILELFRIKNLQERVMTPEVTLEAARVAGLDVERFRADRANVDARRAELAADLERAAALSVFGTPTVQMESGVAAYFRFAKLPETLDGMQAAWGHFQSVVSDQAQIETIKRTRAGSKA